MGIRIVRKTTTKFTSKGKFYNSALVLKRKFLRRAIVLSYASGAVKTLTNLLLFGSIIYFGVILTGHGVNEMAYKTIKIGRAAFVYPLILFSVLLVANLTSSFINYNYRQVNRIKFYSNLFSDIEKSRKKMTTNLLINISIFLFVVIMFSLWFVEINNVGFHEVFFSDSFKHSEKSITMFAKYIIIVMIMVLVMEFIVLGLYITLFIVSSKTVKKYNSLSKYAVEEIIEKEVINE